MENYRKMLRQALQNTVSSNVIARSRGMSHNTVRRAKRLAEQAGLTPQDIDTISDTNLRAILYPKKHNTHYVLPDFDAEIAFMERGYNLTEAHERYVEEVGEAGALKYSAYCQRMRAHRKTLSKVFRHIHQPGFSMQIDFAGYQPRGIENGAAVKFQLLVTALPASHYLFAVATRSQSTEDTLQATIRALEYYGGVPETIVSDNLKAVVIRRPRGRPPVINPRYLSFADYYGVRIDPTRVRRPKDKASVEVGVKLIQRPLRLMLRERPRMELKDINILLRELVEAYNDRPMKRGGETRRQRFERLDQPELSPLPKERMTYIEHPKGYVVPPDYHVKFDGAHYSVPSPLVSKRVYVRHSPTKIEIRHDGQPVAIHERSYNRDEYVTLAAHMPKNHLAVANYDYDSWLRSLLPATRIVVEQDRKLSREAKDRRMLRVRRELRVYGLERFEIASAQALKNKMLSVTHVKNILSNGLDKSAEGYLKPDRRFSPTQNIRGGQYFDRDLNSGEVPE